MTDKLLLPNMVASSGLYYYEKYCSEHHVNNTKEFADEIRKTKLEEGECITCVLWTNKRSCHGVTSKSNSSQYIHGSLWEQSHLNSTAPPRMWKNYVDDTFVIQHHSHKEEFLHHINTVDPSIQFTVEEAKDDGSIPFLDTIITPEADGTFTIGVYRKPKHTDLYLPWDSNHNLAAKYSAINTLTHRAHTICSTPKLIEKWLQHLEKELGLCKYPKWAIMKIFRKQQRKEKKQTPTSKHSAKNATL